MRYMNCFWGFGSICQREAVLAVVRKWSLGVLRFAVSLSFFCTLGFHGCYVLGMLVVVRPVISSLFPAAREGFNACVDAPSLFLPSGGGLAIMRQKPMLFVFFVFVWLSFLAGWGGVSAPYKSRLTGCNLSSVFRVIFLVQRGWNLCPPWSDWVVGVFRCRRSRAQGWRKL